MFLKGGMSSAAAGASAGAAVGVISAAGTGASVAGAAGAGAVAGAVGGSIAGGAGVAAVAGGATGAATGAATAAAVTSASAGASGLATAGGIAAGPIGWIILGTDEFYTFDCWKQVVHDESTAPSQGRFLREVIMDKRIKNVKIETSNDLPQLILENIWDERFRIDYVMLPSNQLTAHASKI